MNFDRDRAVARLMEFLAVEGITGQEKAIGSAVERSLREAGVPAGWIKYDDANALIPLPTETGNLIVTFPGTQPGPRRMLSTHLDTVPLCAGAKPVRKGPKIVPQGKTALGGDNRTGVACLVTTAATLLEQKIPHPPLTFLFTVREESGLWGARFVKPAELGNPTMGFNADGGSPRQYTIAALGADRWEVEIFGKASHAGVHPERGISATLVAALAISQIHKDGWFGKIVKKGHEGTSNVGPFGDEQGRSAGQATNVVTDYVKILGESRSHEMSFIGEITKAYAAAFQEAAKTVKNAAGQKARVKFTKRRDYFPFRLKETSPVVRFAVDAAKRAGWDAELRSGNGGLDANWLTRLGIPTVTFGCGQNNIHTVDEFVLIDDYLDGCKGAPDQGILAYSMGADGSGGDLLSRPACGSRMPPSPEYLDKGLHFMHMDGRAVFRWAVAILCDTIQDVLDYAQFKHEDVQLYLPHQANIRIINAAIDVLKINRNKVFNNLEKYGNTSAGSVPLALDEAINEGRIQRGDHLVMSGFGAGLAWGTALMKW